MAVAIVFVSEATLMLVLPHFESGHHWLVMIADTVILSVIVLLVLRILVFGFAVKDLQFITGTYDQLRSEIGLRKQAESELLKLRKVVELSGEVVFLTDRDGLFNYINPEFTRLYGYSADEVVGKMTPRILKSGKMGTDHYEIFWDTLRKKQVTRLEFINKTKSGEFIQIENSANPILDDTGEIIGYLAIQRDITHRRQVEEQLRQESYFTSTLIQNSPTFVIVVDDLGKIILVNRAALDALGYTISELVGKPFISAIIPESERDSIEKLFRRYLETSTPSIIENTLMAKNGTRITVEWHGQIVRKPDGKFHYMIGFGADITERKRLEELLLQVNETIQQELGQVLHDSLGQELTAITYATKLLERKLAEKKIPESKEASEIVKSVSEAIEEVRNLSRGLYPVDLGTGGFASALQQLAAGTEHNFNVPCTVTNDAADLQMPDSTAIHLYRIAQESALNAVKHAKARSISIQLGHAHGTLFLNVCDDGIGMPDLAESRSGLGIHIMRSRAKLIGATISFQHPETGGTVVSCVMDGVKAVSS